MVEPGRPPRVTILIADDAMHIRRLCAMLLEARDVCVLESGSGPEAVAMYRQHRPDLVLLDLDGAGGGLDALAAIKAEDTEARVVVLTARRDALTVRAVLAAGVRDYVLKPFTRQRLLQAVTRHIGA
jgi:two-component system, chemotaxis family, chemotaxis protein CheY